MATGESDIYGGERAMHGCWQRHQHDLPNQMHKDGDISMAYFRMRECWTERRRVYSKFAGDNAFSTSQSVQ